MYPTPLPNCKNSITMVSIPGHASTATSRERSLQILASSTNSSGHDFTRLYPDLDLKLSGYEKVFVTELNTNMDAFLHISFLLNP